MQQDQLPQFPLLNGKPIIYAFVEGTCWIALKPFCEAIEVDDLDVIEQLIDSEILFDATDVLPMVLHNGEIEEMVCIKEFFFYGWLHVLGYKYANTKAPEIIQAYLNDFIPNHLLEN